jgi:ubiquinone biosynthesis protein COQ9
MTARKKSPEPRDEAARKRSILNAALRLVPQDGFSEKTLAEAGAEAGANAEMLLHLFPDGPASLVAFYSEQYDAEMERLLARERLLQIKVRDRIAAAVLTRLEIMKPHKEAARRAAAFLMLPMNAALAAKLVYRTVDAMWRAAGDTSTDFNFYTKRGILAGVYSATLLRWFNDASADGAATREFLSARIENVMQFEKFKAEIRKRTKDLPSVADVLNSFSARRP